MATKTELQEKFLNAAREITEVWPALSDVERKEHPGRDGSETFLTFNRHAKRMAESAAKYVRRKA